MTEEVRSRIVCTILFSFRNTTLFFLYEFSTLSIDDLVGLPNSFCLLIRLRGVSWDTSITRMSTYPDVFDPREINDQDVPYTRALRYSDFEHVLERKEKVIRFALDSGETIVEACFRVRDETNGLQSLTCKTNNIKRCTTNPHADIELHTTVGC